MGTDLSRVRLNPLLDFAGVELKQGGVVLDGDANELMEIMDRRLRALASDTLGRATVSSTTPDAFKISLSGGALQIGRGRLYVDGLLAECHGASSDDPAKYEFDDLMAEGRFTDPVPYAEQPYLPEPPALPTGGRHLLYLDVWDREVTQLERPDLVEIAVGVETSSRLQTVWQVRVLDDNAGADTTCTTPDADVPGWSSVIAPSSGVLTTGTFEVAPVDDPCELPPTGGYRGLENQLYRVEIHDPGAPGGAATFKWSRENASVGSRVASVVSASELALETLGRDDVLRFNSGDWVEILDDHREFAQEAGEMRRITVDEATRRISFNPALPPAMLPGSFPNSDFPRTRNLRVRRWDQKGLVFRTDPSGTPVQVQDLEAAGSGGVISVPTAATTLLLEDGVTVRFDSTGPAGFRAGDYWVFAARTADASVEQLDRASPRGIHHHYARLGIWDVGAGTVVDCRHPWPPEATGQDCSCTACVTAESHNSGQLTIQAAVDKASETGGTVCLGPGQYVVAEPVRIVGARSLRIRGQGPATLLASPGSAFVVQNSIAIAIESLAILSVGQSSAVSVTTVLGLSLRQLVVAVLSGNDSRSAAFALQGLVAGASIRENAVLAPVAVLANDPTAPPPPGQELPLRILLTAALAIEDNVFWCERRAVSLDGTVLQLLATCVAGNEILGCSDVAISALGLGAGGSSLTVADNNLQITGNGIRCGVDGAWIEDNKVTNTAAAATGSASTTGISLASGLDKDGSNQCQVLSNQVAGFARAGIIVAAPVRELLVKLNIIEACGDGILFAAGAQSSSVAIENNLLRDIGGSTGTGEFGLVTGIGVARTDSASIVGNTIRGLGVQVVQSALRAAILTLAVQRVRINGNEVVEIAPEGDFVGLAAGVLLRGPFADFAITNNSIERDASPSTQPSNGNWTAILTEDGGQRTDAIPIGGLTRLPLDANRQLIIGTGRAFIASAGPTATLAAAVTGARGAILGNVLSTRGEAPAVSATAPGECLFNDNRVEALLNSKEVVVLTTGVAVVNANRVRGGGASIVIRGARASAVLGNVTSAPITVPGGLQAPWDSLNLQA